MEFGFGLPTRGPMAALQSLAPRWRVLGEELGFAIISVSDHIVILEGHQLHAPIQRERYVCRQSIG